MVCTLSPLHPLEKTMFWREQCKRCNILCRAGALARRGGGAPCTTTRSRSRGAQPLFQEKVVTNQLEGKMAQDWIPSETENFWRERELAIRPAIRARALERTGTFMGPLKVERGEKREMASRRLGLRSVAAASWRMENGLEAKWEWMEARRLAMVENSESGSVRRARCGAWRSGRPSHRVAWRTRASQAS